MSLMRPINKADLQRAVDILERVEREQMVVAGAAKTTFLGSLSNVLVDGKHDNGGFINQYEAIAYNEGLRAGVIKTLEVIDEQDIILGKGEALINIDYTTDDHHRISLAKAFAESINT